MSNTCCKFSFLVIVGIICFLLISDTPTGMEPTVMPHFQLEKELNQIPGLNLDRLKNAQYITLPSKVIEDVAVDSNGDIYAICGDGPSTIYKISQSNTSLHYKIGETEGKVLGTALNQKGNLLLMIDDKLGIRMLDLITGKITTIANEYEGHKFGALNSITFASDNIAYFTDSCNFSMDVFHLEILYKTATGKVYGLNLATGKVTLLLGGLQFPNGIVYSQKDNSLYINEIGYYRVIKVPLNGQVGEFTVLIDNLIGYPDNIKITEDGQLWVAIPSLRDKINIFIDNQPLIRKALINARMPQHIFSRFANMAFSGGIKVDPVSGTIIDYFFGKSDKISFVTGIVERNAKLYMSSLKGNNIAVIDYI